MAAGDGAADLRPRRRRRELCATADGRYAEFGIIVPQCFNGRVRVILLLSQNSSRNNIAPENSVR
jgi:hypothetical protein